MTLDDPEHPVNVGKRVKWIRGYCRAKSQTVFAKSLGVSSSRLSQWESGKQRLSIEGALMIFKRYGFTFNFLYLNRWEELSEEMAVSLASFEEGFEAEE